ncbi:Phosphoribosylaminoimidazole-succinocarboxamide synthase [Labeo rohita]|uniref:Phosphoribosylaminoimidazole-succinocarboxamide synthase n=1 Tax=Labeo rohita TaxID=84645 RepID=A0ABQ8L6X6_LABRO|nr:Phosphoribosylaminoimidazole-succinocarboxamide synthase [Labeo rohita]
MKQVCQMGFRGVPGVPGVSGIRVMKDKNDDDLPVITVTDANELAHENTVLNTQAEVTAIETDRHLNNAFDNDLHSSERNICDDTRMETGQADFKVPLKRKKSGKGLIVRHAKKADTTELSDKDETESDSESSDSSVSLSQSDFSGRHYEVDDIKLFLRATKNKRGVHVNEYFPDIKQFVEKTKCFMMECSFTNKEVYQLKKIVRKLNSELSNEDSEKA